MANSKIQDFFNRKFFEIPKYQRGYAWTLDNVRDLFNDIKEAQEVKSNHYIGTVVLSKMKRDDRTFFVVDGQQRIATITMIINAIIARLSEDDAKFYTRFYVKENGTYRLKLLGKECGYFVDLMQGRQVNPINKSQRLLADAYSEIENQVNNMKNVKDFLAYTENLEILEFLEESEGDAIRIFQTVNDRGKPLSNMEKAKSLLVFFSNRYIDKKLDNKINDVFGEIFELYDEIKFAGENLGINLVSSDTFNEDSVMRYHYVTFSDENYDATAKYVLYFLKRELTKLKNHKANKVALENFILSYIESLCKFFKALRDLVAKAENEERYYKLFVILNISATLYPLIVKLEMLNILEKKLPSLSHNNFTFFDIIEIIDVRIYKTRGTDPRAEISRFTHRISSATALAELEEWLLWYNKQWMSSAEFQMYLTGYNVHGNRALPLIFLYYSEFLSNRSFSILELKKIMQDKKLNPTIEHILSQHPKFTLKSHGFKSTEEYREFENTLGNLTLLERSLNSAAQNKSTFDKIPIYDKSKFKMTTEFSSKISANMQFSKANIEARTSELVKYFAAEWWC